MGKHPIVLIKGNTEEFKKMPLAETLKWVEKISCHMASEIDFLKDFESDYPEVLEDLLNEETMNRFKGLAMSLKFPFENFKSYSDEPAKAMLEQGLLVQSWSSLGSLLESTLQMFLAFYYRFYVQSEWSKWDKEAIDQIKEELGSLKEKLEEIVEQNNANDEKGLTSRVKTSFLTKVKDILKQKSDLPKIERITLSELIAFYFSEDVLGSNDAYNDEDLKTIANYRNSIHAFQKRTIGTWEEYNNYLKLVILVMLDILSRLPDIPSEVPIPAWYYEDKTQIVMQEKKWFDYRLGINL